MAGDLTVGNPLKRILGFCVPLLIGNLFQQLYQLINSVIVGRFLGVDAFAAIGSTGSLNNMVMGFALGLCTGLCIPVAQKYGAGDIRGLREAEAHGLYIAGTAAVLVTVLFTLYAQPILVFFQTPESLLGDATAYIRTLLAGSSGLILYNMVIGYVRALGDSKTPLLFLIVAALLNICLDLLFIAVFQMGVTGAALGTVLAQTLSAILCILTIRKRIPILRLNRQHARPSLPVLGRLSVTALPIGLQLSISAAGSILVQIAINRLGAEAVAGMALGGKVQGVFFAPLDALGVAVVIFVSQNFGAGRLDRIRKGLTQTLLASAGYAAAGFAFMWFAGTDFARVFVSDAGDEIYALAQQVLRIQGFFFIPLTVIYVYRNALHGLGYARAAMVSGIFETMARITVALFVVSLLGFQGACLATPAAWTSSELFLLPMYFYAIRKLESRAAPLKAA